MTPIVWRGGDHPELEGEIRKALEECGFRDQDLSGLICHNHFLTDDPNGPMVELYWEMDKLVAQYHEKSTWVQLYDVAKKLTPQGN
jgi:hypothetical protein